MLQKLRHKTPREISVRLYKLVRGAIEERRFREGEAEQWVKNRVPSVTREEFLNNPERPQFFFTPERENVRQLFQQHFGREVEECLRRADGFLEHRFTMLGSSFSFHNHIDWHIDPVTGHSYKRNFYRKVNIFHNDGKTDIKHVWEVNRHQFFIDLAKAYLVTREEKYAIKVIELFNQWVEENPYKIGINWTSALEVAVRAYAWIWALNFLIDSKRVDDEFLTRMLQQLCLHGKYLSENLSFYFSPYNHLIGEASALFMIGYLFPEIPSASKWKFTGWNILETQLPKQFHPDGMTVEQASFYHYFTLGFYLMPVIIKQQNGESIAGQMLTHLKQILEFSMHLIRPDGSTPWIGDIDNARSIYFTEPENWDFRNFLATGAVLFNSPALKFAAGKPWEDILWLFGTEGWQRFQQLESLPPTELCRYFPESGYAVGRSGWGTDAHYFRFDCGPIADGVFRDDTPSAAHGHADILNFELTAYGKNFVIDPGFHNYRGDKSWHQYFRETRAHNCLVIDGMSQATHGGILEWSKAAEPQLLKVVNRDNLFYIRGTHDAYRELPGQPKHYRNFFFINQDIWVVIDEVYGEGSHLVESFLHLSPSRITMQNPYIEIEQEDVQLRLIPWGAEMKREVLEGGKKMEEGWISPLYRQAVPAPMIRFHNDLPLPQVFYMMFIPSRGNTVKASSQLGIPESFRSAHFEYHLSNPGSDVNAADDNRGRELLHLTWSDNARKHGIKLIRHTPQKLSLLHFTTTSDSNMQTNWEEQIG